MKNFLEYFRNLRNTEAVVGQHEKSMDEFAALEPMEVRAKLYQLTNEPKPDLIKIKAACAVLRAKLQNNDYALSADQKSLCEQMLAEAQKLADRNIL